MQLHYVAHATWNHKMQIFRKHKIQFVEFSISIFFFSNFLIKLTVKWLLDYQITENFTQLMFCQNLSKLPNLKQKTDLLQINSNRCNVNACLKGDNLTFLLQAVRNNNRDNRDMRNHANSHNIRELTINMCLRYL